MFDEEEDFELIDSYTRAEALADGTLVDAGDLAREAGFVVPVALTAAAWASCVEWPAENRNQDERGRLWDVLMMARVAAYGRSHHSTLKFCVSCLRRDTSAQQLVELRMTIGPGDTPAPVITILLPGED